MTRLDKETFKISDLYVLHPWHCYNHPGAIGGWEGSWKVNQDIIFFTYV